MYTERFAPSPTGPLHLGHAYSAWVGWTRARAAGGRFLLRMEDLDTSRVRPEWHELIETDLQWLGLDWDGNVLAQSTRQDAYDAAIARLTDLGLVYTCTCTRRDIQDAISAPQEGAAPMGPDGPIYPGTCKEAGHPMITGAALRLDVARALRLTDNEVLCFEEHGEGPAGETGSIVIDRSLLHDETGDIVLRRRDGAPAYHLAVVVDDAHQDVTHVTRGADLFPATPVQRLLQALLGLPTPTYNHHRLVRDDAGKRLAKRDDARAISSYRAAGLSPAEVLDMARAGISDPAHS
ncbi:MAG: tRNA glutamyl-Q(34) synthetase GluQRS [Pseudomonadota bacterium]